MTEQMEIETSYGKEEVDIQRAKKAYADLINDIAHSGLCLCPSCLYQFDKAYRGKYDKEIFFLSWLEFEILFSLVNQTEKIVFETAYDSGNYKKFIEGSDLKSFFKGYGRIRTLSNFIKKNFPKIDHDHKRLKLRLWRFKKSGIEQKIEKEIRRKNFSQSKEMKTWKRSWDDLKFAQRVANFINSRPGKKTTQRALLRHFSNRREEDIERIRGNLGNFGINVKDEEGCRKTTTIYYVTMKNTRGRYWRVGI